jgi:uncharacterized protein YodC (DUF2158 family)
MTITKVDGRKVECQWFNNGELRQAWFNSDALKDAYPAKRT